MKICNAADALAFRGARRGWGLPQRGVAVIGFATRGKVAGEVHHEIDGPRVVGRGGPSGSKCGGGLCTTPRARPRLKLHRAISSSRQIACTFPRGHNATSEWGVPALNKVGHGLRLDSATVFGQYAKSPRIAAVARHVAGLRAPVLPQSMYIFKEAASVAPSPHAGTAPFFTLVRAKRSSASRLALHDAHEGNSCL